MYEFDPSFIVDTGSSLAQVFSGSGVHLFQDVSLSFDFLDQQGNSVTSDKEFINNPLLQSVVFDILDLSGNVAFPAFMSGGTSRSITFTKADNENVFGTYQKDFGVRLSLFNSFDGSSSTGEFYIYGNVPSISGASVSDGTDPLYSDNDQIFDEINVELKFNNNLKYINFEKFDIYAATGACVANLYEDPSLDPILHESFLYSTPATRDEDVFNISIKPIGLEYSVPYYFTIVPYSSLGSGESLCIGPHIFYSEFTGSNVSVLRANEIELFEGDASMNIDFITGLINNTSGALLDSTESGLYHTLLYTVQIEDGASQFTSTDLKLVLNNSSIAFIESPINNTGQLLFTVDQSGLFYNLFVSGVSGSGAYKIYKTSI